MASSSSDDSDSDSASSSSSSSSAGSSKGRSPSEGSDNESSSSSSSESENESSSPEEESEDDKPQTKKKKKASTESDDDQSKSKKVHMEKSTIEKIHDICLAMDELSKHLSEVFKVSPSPTSRASQRSPLAPPRTSPKDMHISPGTSAPRTSRRPLSGDRRFLEDSFEQEEEEDERERERENSMSRSMDTQQPFGGIQDLYKHTLHRQPLSNNVQLESHHPQVKPRATGPEMVEQAVQILLDRDQFDQINHDELSDDER